MQYMLAACMFSATQAGNQAVERIDRPKLNGQLACLFDLAVALDALFDAYLNLCHQQVR